MPLHSSVHMKIGIATVSLLLLLLLALFWRPFRSSASRPEGMPTASAETAGPVGAESAGTNPAISRIFSGDASTLAVSSRTIGTYLQSKGLTAASLLVAFQMETNQEHLLKAAAKFP